jgi:superfamily II DNA helicase RecQ
MAFAFFSVPVRDSAAAAAELNAFLRQHRVLAVDRRWVDAGADSFWAVCVDYLETGGPAKVGPSGARGKVDYKEVLKPDEFAVFARLREWRKAVSQREAVPVYTVFTNEQLADLVRDRVTTKAALGRVEGVGDARVERYGAGVLAVLQAAWPAGQSSHTPTGTSSAAAPG